MTIDKFFVGLRPEAPNPLYIKAVTRMLLKSHSAPSENIVERIGMLGRPGGLRRNQLDAERVREPARDLVLQSEQVACVAVEPIPPKMRVGRGIDQLGADSDSVADRLTLPSST